jgi:putative hydrolase of the HAD superfamily
VSETPLRRTFDRHVDELGLDPGDCLFIDDDPQLVVAAIQLGYHGVALTRQARQTPASVPTITSLDELPPIIAGTPK